LAVVTGIAPRHLMDDPVMLLTMITVVGEMNEERRKAAR